MPSNHESVLWIVEKRQISAPYGSDKAWAKTKRYVFRTRDAAQKFKDSRPARKHFMYTVPERAEWGPDA